METDKKDHTLEQFRRLAGELQAIRFFLLGVAASLAEYQEERETDWSMDARNLAECLVHDCVDPAIRDLTKFVEEKQG